jgi:hypothetical protein
MDMIRWTHTHTGTGPALAAQEALQRIQTAFEGVARPAFPVCDEDFGFVAVADFDALSAEMQRQIVEDIEIRSLEEAVQAWWNLYGLPLSSTVPNRGAMMWRFCQSERMYDCPALLPLDR